MSWASRTFDKAVDKVSKNSPGGKIFGRKRFKEMVASTAGPIGFQYQYSRNKGMNGSEAQTNALTGGMSYQQARGEQQAREAEENNRQASALLQARQRQEEEKARLQIAGRIRRRPTTERPADRSGTLVTGSLGIPGGAAGTSLGTLLGL